ncbi:MAG: NAD(P)-dependent oxidoreductase [Actinomycetota bacterium]|nr:NAD(P)-dependent oxidoreductase [Actinomycetota bacterium]
MKLLVLGAGYLGSRLAELALDDGHEVVLADNWYATEREQLAPLEGRGARVKTADIRRREELDGLLSEAPDRVYLFAAQASRPLSERDPDYTEETNVSGTRRVGEAVAAAKGPPLVFASSIHVYGYGLEGRISSDRPYGAQSDLAHLSKIYSELALSLLAKRKGFDLALLRLGIVYGPSPVLHEREESQTVVDKFKRQAAAGEKPTLDDGGRATIAVVHVDDVARIFLELAPEPGVSVANVAAETVTVADVARLARGEKRTDDALCTYETPFRYEHRVEDYLTR